MVNSRAVADAVTEAQNLANGADSPKEAYGHNATTDTLTGYRYHRRRLDRERKAERRLLMRRFALLAVAPLLILAGACDSDKPASTTPPAAGAKLCDVTDASWWYDATGASDLNS